MKTAANLCLAAALAFALAASYHLDGPSDLQAAQDTASDTSTAQAMAQQAAECQRRFGPGVQVFVLDGQHTVCRPAAAITNFPITTHQTTKPTL